MNVSFPNPSLLDHDDLMSFLTEYLILPNEDAEDRSAAGSGETSLGAIQEVLAATHGDLTTLSHKQLVRLQDAFWQAFQAVAEVQVARLAVDIEANKLKMAENLAAIMQAKNDVERFR